MQRSLTALLVVFVALPLAGCLIDDAPASRPNNRISVIADPEQRGKLVAVAPVCKDWEYDPVDGLENKFIDQFECAQQYNLAKTIADPKDLVHGRVAGPTDSNPSVLGIERYRQDKKKELIIPKEINATTKN